MDLDSSESLGRPFMMHGLFTGVRWSTMSRHKGVKGMDCNQEFKMHAVCCMVLGQVPKKCSENIHALARNPGLSFVFVAFIESTARQIRVVTRAQARSHNIRNDALVPDSPLRSSVPVTSCSRKMIARRSCKTFDTSWNDIT